MEDYMESNPKEKRGLFSFKKKEEPKDPKATENNSLEKKQESKQAKFKSSPVSVTKTTPIFVFSFDVYDRNINIMHMIGNDYNTCEKTSISYRTNPVSKEFFEKFPSYIENYLEEKKSDKRAACFVVLPNQSISLDFISVPTVGKKQIVESANTLLNSSYRNVKDLILRKSVISTTKQLTTFGILSLKKEELSNLYLAMSMAKLNLNSTTYFANALLSAVLQLKNKNKGHSFIFLDVRKDSTAFVFVYKGFVIGYYRLPYYCS